jgi:type I restriction enzyme R subunit
MQQSNFGFLQEKAPELAASGKLAEQLLFIDTGSSAVKLRTFAEKYVRRIYDKLGLPLPYNDDLKDLLEEFDFKKAIPEEIRTTLHRIRSVGNRGAHGKDVDRERFMGTLEDAYRLGKWFYVRLIGGDLKDCPAYKTLAKPHDPAEWQREKAEIQGQLAKREQELEQMISEL